MVKRAFLFLLTNFLVLVTIGIIFTIFGGGAYLTPYGIDFKALLLFCFIWGSVGSFISLAMSKFIAKRAYKITILDPAKITGPERYIYDTVARLVEKAKLPAMPEVGIYESPEVNAFATGPSKKNSLLAVSSGLLQQMDHNEVEGVLGHEVSHISNGDMVTMALIQGIVNAFALFLSRIVAYIVAMFLARGSDSRGMSMGIYFVLTIVFDIIFTLLGSMVTASFSRWREYRADEEGAKVAGFDKMIAALEKLRSNAMIQDTRGPSISELKISHTKGFISLFATHPPLTKRIARLRRKQG